MIRMCDLFFFIKQMSAYELRISDWSSDVCSSDLSSRLIRRHWPMLAKGDEALLALDAAFDDIDLAPVRIDAQAEAPQFLVPDRRDPVAGRSQIGGAFREFRHELPPRTFRFQTFSLSDLNVAPATK